MTSSSTPPADPGAARASLSRVYRSTGVFFWASQLSACGVDSPVRAIHLIGRTLAQAPRFPTSASEADAKEWVRGAMADACREFASDSTAPLPELAQAVAPVMEWNPYEELAELMVVQCGPAVLRNVRGQLATKGFKLDFVELHDLSAMFASQHLSAAVVSFDAPKGEGRETAWLTTVFYRFALKHILTTRRLEGAFSAAFDIPDPASAPEAVIEERIRSTAMVALPQAINALRPLQRRAIALYFGFEGPERSLAQVAKALSVNAYVARAAVATGIGAIAAALGVTGLLEDDELQVAELMFLQSHDVDAVAQALGMSCTVVRKTASRIGVKLRLSLRARTRSATTQQLREADMSHLHSFVEAFASSRVELERDDRGELWARWPGEPERHRAGELLDTLRSEAPQLLDRVVDSGDDARLSELFSPSPSQRRADLLSGQEEWEQILEEASAGALANAAIVHRRWLEASGATSQPDASPDSAESTVARIRDALSTTSSALEEMLPWERRVAGSAVLQLMRLESGEINAYWAPGLQLGTEPMELRDLVAHRLGLVGGFQGQSLHLLTECVLEGILQQTCVLPGFQTMAAPIAGRVAFRWTRTVYQ
jgi:hypothetical protein